MDKYKEIFDKRGNRYHNAMNIAPQARKYEFLYATNFFKDYKGKTILDVPSGGCYLERYLKNNIIISADTSSTFLRTCDKNKRYFLNNIFNLPFSLNHFDGIISIAGLHHYTNREKQTIISKCSQHLKKNGKLCICDVQANTPPAYFLNNFVDRYNPEGHKGIFLSANFIDFFQSSGIKIIIRKYRTFYWEFVSKKQMYLFLTNLFGLSNISYNDLKVNITYYLGEIKEKKGKFLMPWGLVYYYGIKVN